MACTGNHDHDGHDDEYQLNIKYEKSVLLESEIFFSSFSVADIVAGLLLTPPLLLIILPLGRGS